jgi:hypothetical protein
LCGSISSFEPNEAIALLSTSSGARWKSCRVVADAAGPVRGPDDEQAAELEEVDGGFVGVGVLMLIFGVVLACGAGAVMVVMVFSIVEQRDRCSRFTNASVRCAG